MHVRSDNRAVRPPVSISGGFAILYHADSDNHCPACGRDQWIIGRVTAQCAFCETALPLDRIAGHGYSPRFVTQEPVGGLAEGTASGWA